jgi:RNA polymerase sigma-70 factor (ECF subfamily)
MLDRQAADEANDTQTQLLRRVAAQDRQALAEFYDLVAGVLFSTSVRILSDPQEAEEVIQDVFVQIWDKASTFDVNLGSPFHWALSITRNRSIDRLRSRQRRSRLLEELRGESPPDTEIFSAPAEAEGRLGSEDAAAVRSAVNSLPAEQRQAIELAFFGGLTHAEIATAVGEPLGTIKARIRRGMLKLRDSLQTCV